ncbi:MAG: DHH family phosphoesterase, partial [Candidatus Limivicinus sp.]|nr:DHH family phosphoesterase [Candidatus Limivicinus sp.]
MSEIYVTGHRNPDTDSIVAAMAYANLRKALGDREYTAVRIGSVNDETLNMLKRFGFEAPPYIKNMRNQVCDLDFDHPPELHRSVPLELAWQSMREGQIATIPILNDDGTLYGVLSAGDVASYDLRTVYENMVSDIPLFNLISVLEGYLVNEFAETSNSVSGKVQIAVPKSYSDEAVLSPESILICGDQPEVIKTALEAQVGCLIICQADIAPELTEIAGHSCIISTPLDARQAARLIYQAVPVMRLCQTQDIVCFHLSDYIDDVKETLLNSRYRCYPVLDENEKVVGTLSRFHLLRPRRKRVVLVDHNEASQSVSGLEQVEILEIIDHHRLA